ncbi:hypothetical protein J6590_000942 [Homalodisca vitripennis]|nr:hypothetical protein J6590_000942 [Homalodisca vitripennis]
MAALDNTLPLLLISADMNSYVVLVAVMASLVHAAPSWNGPLASPVVLPSGYLADTPEVVSLRAAHLAALSAAPGGNPLYAPLYDSPADVPFPKWNGPLASPVVLPSGYLADTPEVVALRAAHAAALAHSYH